MKYKFELSQYETQALINLLGDIPSSKSGRLLVTIEDQAIQHEKHEEQTSIRVEVEKRLQEEKGGRNVINEDSHFTQAQNVTDIKKKTTNKNKEEK